MAEVLKKSTGPAEVPATRSLPTRRSSLLSNAALSILRKRTSHWVGSWNRRLAPAYLRRKQLGCRFARFQCSQALAYVVAQHREGNSPERVRVAVQSAQRCLQQQHGSERIVTLQVMERRSHLDQPLQECLLWLGRRQPHTFPC